MRVYWPKGRVAMGASSDDRRATLSHAAIDPVVKAIEGELLRRFGAMPHFAEGLIDSALRHVMVPFNERTASLSAVNLPRGSRITIPDGKRMRLFLHWWVIQVVRWPALPAAAALNGVICDYMKPGANREPLLFPLWEAIARCCERLVNSLSVSGRGFASAPTAPDRTAAMASRASASARSLSA